MAADSLLPLFHENPAGNMSDAPSEGDDILAELLGGAGDDLLASLLEPSPGHLGLLSPPLSSPPFPSLSTSPPAHSTSTNVHISFHPDHPLLASTSEAMTHSSLPSPPNDGYVSDTSNPHHHSPYSYTSYSPVDMLGNSPASASPSDVMVTSSGIISTDELDALLGSLTSVSSGGSSSEVKINVDPAPGLRGVQAVSSDTFSVSSSCKATSSRKAATLVLTEEEKQLLSAEGVSLPTDMPLTKQEQKHLKRVQRKIKNKLSAQESRKRKKEYVEGLEERVECCTETNQRLRDRVGTLESENKSLFEQLRKLRSVVAKIYPSKLQAGTLLMVLSLSFSLLVFPWPRPPGHRPSAHTVTVHSRTLLFTETDEFGNIIDPETGHIVSEHGGLSPTPPYPWSLQTPAFLSVLTSTLSHGHVTLGHDHVTLARDSNAPSRQDL